MIKELLKDMGKYLPSQIAPAMVGFIAIPIVTHLFPPAIYGDYVLVMATVTVLATIVGWLPTSIIRFYPAYERDRKLDEFYANVIKLTAISILIISLAFLSILLLTKSHISSKLYSLMWVGIAVFILTAAFNVLQHFLRAKRQVSWYSGFSIWKSVMALAFGVLLIMAFHFGIESLLWGSILSLAIAFPFLWKKSIERVSLGSRGVSFSLTSTMAKYGFPLVVGNLAAWILSLSDRYILEFFRGSQEVGIYSASYGISGRSIMLLATLFMLAAGPIGMSVWEKEGKERSQEFVSKLTRYYLIICLPAVVGLSVLAKPLVNILTGQEYYEGYRIIPLVASGALFLGLQQRFQAGPLFYKRTHFIMFSIVAAGLLNLGLNFLLVPQYGYRAAAATTLISYVFLLLLMVVISRRLFIWEFPFRSLAKATYASVIMGMVVYYVGNSLTSSVLVNLILGICVGATVYFLMLLLLREFSKEEIQMFHLLKQRVLR